LGGAIAPLAKPMVGYPYTFLDINTYFRARHQHSNQHIFICPNSFHGFEEFLCEKFRCIQCNLRNCQQTISDVRGELAFDAVFNTLVIDLRSMSLLIVQSVPNLTPYGMSHFECLFARMRDLQRIIHVIENCRQQQDNLIGAYCTDENMRRQNITNL